MSRKAVQALLHAGALPLHEGHVCLDRPAHPHHRLRPRSARRRHHQVELPGPMRLAMEGITSFSTALLRWATGLGVAAALAGVGFASSSRSRPCCWARKCMAIPRSGSAWLSLAHRHHHLPERRTADHHRPAGRIRGQDLYESKQRPVYLLRDAAQPHGGIAPAWIRTRRGGGPCLRIRATTPPAGAPGRPIRRHDRRGSACGQLASFGGHPRAAVRHGGHAAGRHLGTALRRDRAPDGRHDWVTPWFELGVLFGASRRWFLGAALSIKLLGLSEFSLLPAFAAMLGMLALVHAFALRHCVSAARWARWCSPPCCRWPAPARCSPIPSWRWA